MEMRGTPLTRVHVRNSVHLCARRIEGTTPRPNPAPQQANAWARPRTEWQKRTPHACSSTRTRHRPGAPSDKGRRTRRSRCLRGSESGDSLWLLEVDKGVVSCASCGFGVAGRRHSPHAAAMQSRFSGRNKVHRLFCLTSHFLRFSSAIGRKVVPKS